MRQVSEQHPMPFVNAPTVARPPARHPAKFTDTLLPAIAKLLRPHVRPGYRVLDPFAGVGKIFLLNQWYPGMQIEGIEIEPEWAAQHPRTTLGNALALPWADSHFDAIVTSPTYGNRMADSHTARDSSRRKHVYSCHGAQAARRQLRGYAVGGKLSALSQKGMDRGQAGAKTGRRFYSEYQGPYSQRPACARHRLACGGS